MSLEQNIAIEENTGIRDIKEALRKWDIDSALHFASETSSLLPGQKEEMIVSHFETYEKIWDLNTHFPHSPEALEEITSILGTSLA